MCCSLSSSDYLHLADISVNTGGQGKGFLEQSETKYFWGRRNHLWDVKKGEKRVTLHWKETRNRNSEKDGRDLHKSAGSYWWIPETIEADRSQTALG